MVGLSFFVLIFSISLSSPVSLLGGTLFCAGPTCHRRGLECCGATNGGSHRRIPPMAGTAGACRFLIPVLTGMAEVYPWANAEEVAHDPLLQWKQPYLNAPFFIVRDSDLFWCLEFLAPGFIYRCSVAQDKSGDERLTLRMQRLAGFNIVLFGFTVTFFSIDLIQSMTPHWYSTMYGVYYFAGSTVSFFALLSVVMFMLQRCGLLESLGYD